MRHHIQSCKNKMVPISITLSPNSCTSITLIFTSFPVIVGLGSQIHTRKANQMDKGKEIDHNTQLSICRLIGSVGKYAPTAVCITTLDISRWNCLDYCQHNLHIASLHDKYLLTLSKHGSNAPWNTLIHFKAPLPPRLFKQCILYSQFLITPSYMLR